MAYCRKGNGTMHYVPTSSVSYNHSLFSPRVRIISVGAQSTLGEDIFARKYMHEKLIKWPNFTWFCPKNISPSCFLEGGQLHCPPSPPPSPTPMVRMYQQWIEYWHQYTRRPMPIVVNVHVGRINMSPFLLLQYLSFLSTNFHNFWHTNSIGNLQQEAL